MDKFVYDEQKIKNYAKKLLKEKFPPKKEYKNTLVGYKIGDSFKLGEITFKIDYISKYPDSWIDVHSIEGGDGDGGGMFFNNQEIGSWSVDLTPEEENDIEYFVNIYASENDPINTDAHIEQYSTLKELENKI